MTGKQLKSKFVVNINHLSALCRRYVSLIVSDKTSMFTLLFQAPIMLLLIYLACSKDFYFYKAQETMFIISAICVIMATLNSYREICKERDVLIRETNAGLDSTAYILSKVIIQGVICFFQSIILVVGTSLIFPFNISGFFPYFQYFLMTYLILLSATAVGLFISAILKNSDTAILPVLFIIIAQVVLNGVIIKLPEDCQFLSVLAITRWGLGGYSHIFDFKQLAEDGEKLSGFPLDYSYIYDVPMWIDVLVLVGITVLCVIFSAVAIKKLRKRKF